MAKQTCTPSRIFAPVDAQYLFCGCSVMNVRCTLGWNDQITTVEVSLVEDTCSPPADRPKIYFDANLVQRELTGPDPGFTNPLPGSAAYLRLGDFEFSGIIQSLEQLNSEGGNPTFSVVLVDPRVILQATQVIIADYAGELFGVSNIINVYGYLESKGQKCPPVEFLGATFGSPAGGFGGSNVNVNGIQWNILREGLSLLTSSIPATINKFSPWGRLVYKASPPQNSGYGVYKHDFIDIDAAALFPNASAYQSFYLLDLSEIPGTIDDTYRINGTNISLLDLIVEVCQDAGCDFYVELVPIRLGGVVLKVIKVRIVVRLSQPILGSIQNYVDSTDHIMNKTLGYELRPETTTKFLIGGPVESIYQADEDELREAGLIEEDQEVIKPYFGTDANGNLIPVTYDGDGKLQFNVDITQLNALLYQPLSVDTVTITEYELQAALTGQDAWLAMAAGLPSTFGTELNMSGVVDANRIQNVLNRVVFAGQLIVPGKKGGPAGLINLTDIQQESQKLKDIETIYNFVLNFARDYYGKRYIVQVPYTCSKIDQESRQTQSSESPTDSGWTETPNIIGLNNPGLTEFFKDDNGKIVPFVRIDDARNVVEITNIPEEDYVLLEDENDSENATLFLRAQTIGEEFVFTNYAKRLNPHVVIELSAPVLEKLQANDVHRVKQFTTKFFNLVAPGAAPPMVAIGQRVGNSLLHLGIESTFKKPDAAAVAIKSNVQTYGPWYALGPHGQIDMERDDGFVPWNYGSTAKMALAGVAKVSQGVTNLQITEMGSITIPGYPALPLGAELQSGGISALESRSVRTTTPKFTTELVNNKGKWDATSGNAPELTPKKGVYYTVSKAGTTSVDGNDEWNVNDIIVYNGARWERQTTNNTVVVDFATEAWSGENGPNITNINIDVNEGGIVTTYSMRTYTPKFGRFSKRNSDKLSEQAQLFADIEKRARLIALREIKIKNNREVAANRVMSNRFGSPLSNFAASPPGVLIGQSVRNDDGFVQTAVHVIKHNELITETEDYEHKAMMSLDGLLRPVSLAGAGDLPRLASFDMGCLKGSSDQPEPPVVGYTGIDINQTYLNPWAGPDSDKHADSLAGFDGHDIDILARGTELPDSLSIPLQSGETGYTDDYRGFALKGPLLLQQWGYDIQGKPVPNAADNATDTANGLFVNAGLKDKFLPGFLRKPETWPVAPVDLRFDRKRGVWVAPQPFRIVQATLSEDMNGSTIVSAQIVDGAAIEDADGTAVPKVINVNPVSTRQKGKNGDTILAYYDPNSCDYKVLWTPPDSVQGQIFIGKAVAASQSLTPPGDTPSNNYDIVNVHRCSTIDGTRIQPLVTDTVLLLKHATTAQKTSNLGSAFHQHDIAQGDILLYVSVDTDVGTKYVAVTDYSREQSIFLGAALRDSVAPNFDRFSMRAAFLDGEEYDVTIENHLKQPILENDCGFIYRHRDHDNNGVEYWLLQGIFAPYCLVSDITIYTQGEPSFGSAWQTQTRGFGCPSYTVTNAKSNSLNFTIRDFTMYSESAWKEHRATSGGTYVTAVVEADVFPLCASSGNKWVSDPSQNACFVHSSCPTISPIDNRRYVRTFADTVYGVALGEMAVHTEQPCDGGFVVPEPFTWHHRVIEDTSNDEPCDINISFDGSF